MDERLLKEIIANATQQVMRHVNNEDAPAAEQKGALVIISQFVPDSAALTDFLRQVCGGGFECVIRGDFDFLEQGVKITRLKSEADERYMISELQAFSQIVLAVPPLGMIKHIAEGDDSDLFERVFLKAVLWRKAVTLLLDFEKPKFRRGTFFESLSDNLDSIEDMGVQVVSLMESQKEPSFEKSLVTEFDVAEALRCGVKNIKCLPGAIVTPLARDKAKECGVAIN